EFPPCLCLPYFFRLGARQRLPAVSPAPRRVAGAPAAALPATTGQRALGPGVEGSGPSAVRRPTPRNLPYPRRAQSIGGRPIPFPRDSSRSAGPAQHARSTPCDLGPRVRPRPARRLLDMPAATLDRGPVLGPSACPSAQPSAGSRTRGGV